MMRILQVVHGWFPRHCGGTERYAAKICEELRAAGHETAVLTGSDVERTGAGWERQEWNGFEVFVAYRRGLYLESWYRSYSPDVELATREVIETWLPDVIHIHHWQRLTRNLVEIAIGAGRPVVCTLHDTSSTCPKSFRIREGRFCELQVSADNCIGCVDRFPFQGDVEVGALVESYRDDFAAELRGANRIIVPSRALQSTIERQVSRIDRRRISVLPHGDIDDERGRARPRGRRRGGKMNLAYWGAIVPMKGLHLLLEAMRRLPRRVAVTLDVFGTVPEEDEDYRRVIEALADRLPVRFHGAFTPEDLSFGLADLAVFPSICLETFSFTVSEAWNRGMPVIVPDRGAPAERLDGAGITFKAESIDDLTRTLVSLFDAPDRVAAMRAAIKPAQPMHDHVERIVEIYRQAIDEGARVDAIDGARAVLRGRLLATLLEARDTSVYELSGRVEQTSELRQHLEKELSLRDEIIGKKDSLLEEFSKSLQELSRASARQIEEISALTQQRAEQTASFDRRLSEYEAAIVRKDETLGEFEKSIAAHRHLIDDRERELAAYVARAEGSERRLTAAETEIESRDRRIVELTRGLEARKRDLEASRILMIQRDDDREFQIAERTASIAAELSDVRRHLEAQYRRVEESERDYEEQIRRFREESASHVDRMAAAESNSSRVACELASSLELQDRLRDELRSALERAAKLEADMLDATRRIGEAEVALGRFHRITTNVAARDIESARIVEEDDTIMAMVVAELARMERHLERQEAVLEMIDVRLRPIAEEAAGRSLLAESRDVVIEHVIANHARLHGLLGEREQVLTALVEGLSTPTNGTVGDVIEQYQKRSKWLGRKLVELRRRMRSVARGRRLRVLIVVHDFLPKHAAGTEIYTYNLAKQLASRHDVHLLFCEARHELPRYTISKGAYDGLPYTEVVHNYKWENFEESYKDPKMEAIFESVLDEFSPDIVHIQHLHYFSIDFVPIAKQRGVPVIYTLHEYILMCARGGQLRRPDGGLCDGPVPEACAHCISHEKLGVDYGQGRRPFILEKLASVLPGEFSAAFSRFAGPIVPSVLDASWLSAYERAAARRIEVIKSAIRDVDLFVSPSAFLRQKFIDCGFVPQDKIIHSDNGFDITPFQAAQRTPSSKLRFGFVGTIAEYKGVHILVEAFDAIEEDDVELQIWGDLETFQEYKQRLLPLIRNPRIATKGRFDNRRIAEVLAGIDVLIVPSLWFENSPLTIHEAWMAGIPVVASDRGGMAELVRDGVNGLLFEMGSVTDLRSKIRRFIDDRSLVTRLAANVDRVKSIVDNAREVEGWYYDLLVGTPTS